jgi:hypothetical protein
MSDEKNSEKVKKEADYIEKTARFINKTGMDVPAIILLNTFKPLAFIMGELSSFFLAPFFIILADTELGFDFIDCFEKTENINKLVKRVEELSKKKTEKMKLEK